MVAVALVAAACGRGDAGREAAPPPSWPVDVSTMPGNQMETTVAIDPRDGDRIVVAGNNDGGVVPAGSPPAAPSGTAPAAPGASPRPGLLLATTRDGGRTWDQRLVARGGADGLPDACCDPQLAWDAFGNLFLSYLSLATPDPECPLGRADVVLARSEDAGATFADVRTLANGCIDQPKIATAAGAVWVAYRSGSDVVARGARVTGRGEVAAFGAETPLPGSRAGNYASVTVGADGEVLVAYVTRTIVKGEGVRTVVRVNTDPDGLGPAPFDGGRVVSATTMSNAERLAAQPTRGTDAQPQVAVDRSRGAFRGRAYVAYVDRAAAGGTRVLLRSSSDGGATWTGPVAVAPGHRPSAQLLPALAVDPDSGRVGVTYYDTVLDAGAGGGDTDGTPDTDTGRYAAVSEDGGATFAEPVALSRAPSNARFAYGVGLDYGDYAGAAFEDGVLVAAWADNSDWTGGNPDGRRAALDVYVAAWRPG